MEVNNLSLRLNESRADEKIGRIPLRDGIRANLKNYLLFIILMWMRKYRKKLKSLVVNLEGKNTKYFCQLVSQLNL